MSTYRIIRFFAGKHNEDIGDGGLTLEEAQEHCSGSETESGTCTSPEGLERTAKHGSWFDGYTEE